MKMMDSVERMRWYVVSKKTMSRLMMDSVERMRWYLRSKKTL